MMTMSQPNPLIRRLLAKLVLDILPATIASAIGGLLLTHYHIGRTIEPAPAEQPAVASAEMVKLVRDEHALMFDYLNTQLAAEKARLAAQDRANARAPAAAPGTAGSSQPAPTPALTRRPAAAPAAARLAMPRAPVILAAAPVALPVAVAPAQPNDNAQPPRQTETLLDKTMKIKDNVLGVTWRVANAIGGIPSWIASVGDRIGAPSTNS